MPKCFNLSSHALQILKLYLAYFKFLHYFVITYCLIEIYVIILKIVLLLS